MHQWTAIFVLLGDSAAVSLVATGACGLQPWAHLMPCRAFWRCEPRDHKGQVVYLCLFDSFSFGMVDVRTKPTLSQAWNWVVACWWQLTFKVLLLGLHVLFRKFCKLLFSSNFVKKNTLLSHLKNCLRRAKCPTVASFSNILRANGCAVAGWKSTQHIGWSAFESFWKRWNFLLWSHRVWGIPKSC